MTILTIKTPDWAKPLLEPSRYKCIYGGRGSGKSHERAEAMVERHIMDANCHSVCIREVQRTLHQSVKKLLEDKIEKMGVGHYFDVQDSVIKNKFGNGQIIFQGMQNHTAESIKSLEGYDIAWVEEAQSLSQRSLDILRPTLRKEASEIWFTWNPYKNDDPVDNLFRGEIIPPKTTLVKVNWDQNPWFPDVLKQEMEYDKSRDYSKYLHVWEGEYVQNSKARVFSNWSIEEFDAPRDVHFRFGADWGFANDPTVLVRCYIVGRRLYIDYEAYRVGLEIDHTPALFLTIPEAEKWPIVADSSRPETISFMKKHGFPKIMSAVKGANSINEGIEFLKNYDLIVHPRCKHVIDELTHYSYKIDPITDEILPIFEDKNNHVIDALRYACEGLRRAPERKEFKYVEYSQ